MSIILGVIIKDLFGNKEMILASDGRSLALDTKEIRSEETEKIKKLTNRICMGYVGQCGELYKDVYNQLKNNVKNKVLLAISYKLRGLILDTLKTQKYDKWEKQYGPLNNQFIVGGLYNKKLRFYTLSSINKFDIRKSDLPPSKNIYIEIMGSSLEIHQKVKTIVNEKLNKPQSVEMVIRNLRFIISKVAEQTHDINNHIFIRRLSRNFELESYIGYE